MQARFTVLDEIIGWLKRKTPSIETAQKSVPFFTLLTLLATLFMLIFVGAQTCLLNKQTQILQSDFEARSRPYLAIDSIQMGPGDVHIAVKNYGTLPAVNVKLDEMDLYWPLPPATGTGNFTCSELPDSVTICAEPGFVTMPSTIGITGYDKILYPGRINDIDFSIDEDIYNYIVEKLEGKFAINIKYSSGQKDYLYHADLALTDGIWGIYSETELQTE